MNLQIEYQRFKELNEKRTQGAWALTDFTNRKGYKSIDAKDHESLAEIVWQMTDDNLMNRNSSECEANAQFIAASPSIFAALEVAMDIIEKQREALEMWGAIGTMADKRVAEKLGYKTQENFFAFVGRLRREALELTKQHGFGKVNESEKPARL